MPKQAAHGEGSLRQRPDGRWEYRIHVEGRAQPLSFYSKGDNGRGAKRLYRAWLKENINQAQVERIETVEGWSEVWLSGKKVAVAPKTYENYAHYVRQFILPALGKKRLNDVRPYQIEQIFIENAALSRSALNEIKVCLQGIFKSARKNRLCLEDPTDGIVLKAAPPKAPKVHTLPEVLKILAYAPTHKWGAYVELALYTGLRSEELCGLLWADVDMNSGTLYVHQVVAEVENPGDEALMKPDKNGKVCRRRKYAITPYPKSKKPRMVALNGQGLAVLQRLARKKTSLYVLPAPDGSFLHPPMFAQRYAAVLRDLNKSLPADEQVQTLSPHKARHTYASELLSGGADVRDVQEQLGHAKLTTTQIYLHTSLDAQKRNVVKLTY